MTPKDMKARYRLFLLRKSIYYAFDNTTKTFESLKTKDKSECCGGGNLSGAMAGGGAPALRTRFDLSWRRVPTQTTNDGFCSWKL